MGFSDTTDRVREDICVLCRVVEMFGVETKIVFTAVRVRIKRSRPIVASCADTAQRPCGADSTYPNEGCGKTLAKINDTIPHTRIDMGYQSTQNMLYHKHLYESEYCSVSSPSFEKYHIFIRGLAKNTFTICNIKQHKLIDLHR
jgi:hypothetical protein